MRGGIIAFNRMNLKRSWERKGRGNGDPIYLSNCRVKTSEGYNRIVQGGEKRQGI